MQILWNLIPGRFRLWAMFGAGGIILATLTGTFLYIKNIGYQEGYTRMQIVCELEKAVQTAANNQAIAIAADDYSEAVEDIQSENERLEDELIALAISADQDVDANTCGISAGSVQRLNAIR